MANQTENLDLQKQLNELKLSLYAKRIKSDKPHEVGDLKRQIARLQTKINAVKN